MTTSRIAGLWEGPGCGHRRGSGHDGSMIRWLRPRGGVGEPPVQVMAQTLARHFDAAHVDGSTVRLGFADLTVRCQVGPVGRLGSFFAVPLYFWLSGGPLGSKPIFASISGYEQSPRNAVIAGTCNWACSFGPVLYSGLAGAPVTDPDTDEFAAVLEGRRYRVVLAKVDRAMSYTSDNDTMSRFRAARSRHGGRPWLIPSVLASNTLPTLSARASTVLSLFILDTPHERTVEVKVNGTDWAPAASVFATGEPEPPGGVSLLRELAVLAPLP